MGKSKIGGAPNLDLASTSLPSRKHVTLSAPRMLTPSEIESLRQHKSTIATQAKAIFKAASIAKGRSIA